MKSQEFTIYVDEVDIDFYDMKLVSYETQSYAKRKTTGVDIPGAHGAQAVPSALATNGFTATVVCSGTDADDVNMKIREFFAFMYSTPDARKIVFSDDDSIARYAILDSPEKYKVINGIDNSFAQIKLVFLMLDPFMHSTDANRVVHDAAHGEEIVVINEAFECPAIFTLQNGTERTVDDFSIVVNGELASFSCELAPGDVLVLDTVEYEVRHNGDIRLDFWKGEMPMLKNGNNTIFQQNAKELNLILSVEFTKKWV